MKLFLLDSMKYTPFTKSDCLSYLAERGVVLVEKAKEADFLVTRWYPLPVRQYIAAVRSGIKKILVWTHEPRHAAKDIGQGKLFPGLEVSFMTMYTHDVYLNNYAPFYGFRPLQYNDASEVQWRNRQNKIVALAKHLNTNRLTPLWHDGVNIDLRKLRQNMILEARELNFLDIYGKGWPESMSQNEDGVTGKDWVERKLNIMKDYRYNIALENTNWYHYVSEKLWQSIEAGCLPVYYGANNRIYDDFPRDSFVDSAQFNSNRELFLYLQTMTEDEFTERLNKCFDTYNSVHERLSNNGFRLKDVLDQIIAKLQKANQ